MSTVFKTIVAGTVIAFCFGAAAPAAEFRLDLKPVPEGLTTAGFRLYIPDSIKPDETVRGLIGVSNHEAGARLYDDEGWRKLAEKLKFGIIMYELRQQQPPEAKGNPRASPRGQTIGNDAAAGAFKAALVQLAQTAKRPELEFSCVLTTGLSRGGMQASLFAKTMPDRVIGAVAIHGFNDGSDSEAARKVPCLATIGATDNLVSDRPFPAVLAGRAKDAVWGAVIEPGIPHANNGDQRLPLKWAEAIIGLRLPKEIAKDKPVKLLEIDPAAGYLGELTYTKAGDKGVMTVTKVAIAAYKNFDGDKGKMQWLPNEEVAKLWQACCQGEFKTPGQAGKGKGPAKGPPTTQPQP